MRGTFNGLDVTIQLLSSRWEERANLDTSRFTDVPLPAFRQQLTLKARAILILPDVTIVGRIVHYRTDAEGYEVTIES